MPPKTCSGPSKKTEAKKKEKVIEDKTFGLKNKKGAKQQKFIQQVSKQVQMGGTATSRKLEVAKELDKLKKPEDDPLGALFKPVQKIDKGADPKSILCAFFKQGQCAKGDKCKFSHDLTIERKAEKRSLYCDDKEEDTMDQWDDQKLKDVVEKKHAADNDTTNKTDIICKHFLSAVEISKYGWFWECPSGPSCIYRHALPPGFVLKRDKKLLKELAGDKPTLEEWIETERHKLDSSKATKVTLDSFVSWKKRKINEKKEHKVKENEQKLRDFKEGNKIGLSGREMFTFNPDLADNSDEEGEAFDYGDCSDQESDENDENNYKEIQLDDYDLYADLGNLKVDEDLFNEDDL